MRFRRLMIAVLIAMTLPLAACGGRNVKEQRALFKKSVEKYNDNLRWQKYGPASSFVKKELKTIFLETYELQRDTLNITDFSLATAEIDEDDPNKGTARVWITYFRYPDVKVQKELQVQRWSFNEDKGRWYVELPELEARLEKTKAAEKTR